MAFLERINPFSREDSRVTVSALAADRADYGPETEAFMDEPADGTGGFDDSLASEVGDRVKKIVDVAERDATAVHDEAEEDARRLLDRARAEARKLRDDATRGARALAEDRMRRIVDLRRAIDSRAGQLASLGEDPEEVTSGIELFLRALDDRAGLIAREIDPEAAAAQGDPGPPAETPAPSDVRLGALRMAVAGASRKDLEAELCQTLDAQDAAAILDDVFGRPRSPFPKWAAAAKRAG